MPCPATKDANIKDRHPAVNKLGNEDDMPLIPRNIPTAKAKTVQITFAVINILRIVIAGFGGSNDALTPESVIMDGISTSLTIRIPRTRETDGT
jgi:hypothetical protein